MTTDRYYLRNPERLGGADRRFQADWGLKHDDSDIEYIRADLARPTERHQRLVEAAKGALELILGAPGIICRPDLCETCARCQTRDGNDCLLVTNLKAALAAGEE